MERFYVELNSKQKDKALRSGPGSGVFQKSPEFVAGDKLPVELFLLSGGVVQSASVSESIILGVGEVRKDMGTRLLAYCPLTASVDRYTGLLNLGTVELRSKIGSGSYFDLTLEVQTSGSVGKDTVLQAPVRVLGDLLNEDEGFSINEVISSVALASASAASAYNSAISASYSADASYSSALDSSDFANDSFNWSVQASSSAENAKTSENLSLVYSNQAQSYASQASDSANLAYNSEVAASESAAEANLSKLDAESYASTSEINKGITEANKNDVLTASANVSIWRNETEGFYLTSSLNEVKTTYSASLVEAPASMVVYSASVVVAESNKATYSASLAVSSANSAQTSATNAANSAAQAALIAAGMNYKGLVSGSSVPSTSTNSGDFYLISVAGTSQSKTWAVNDLAIYKGTSGQWDQISNSALVSAYVDPIALSRSPLDSLLNFDGVTGNRRVYWPIGISSSAKMTKWTLDFSFQPTHTTGNMSLVEMGENNSGAASGNVTSFFIRPTTNYRLSIADGAGGTAVYDLPSGSLPSTSRLNRITLVRDGATFSVYIDGVSIPLTLSGANTLNPEIGTDGSWLVAGFAGAQSPFSGVMPIPRLLNRALSQSEIQQVGQVNDLLLVDKIGGSVIPFYSSSFSSGVDSFTAQVGTVVGNMDGISDGVTSYDDCLMYSGSGVMGYPAVVRGTGLTVGNRYRLNFKFYIPSGSASGRCYINQSSGNTLVFPGTGSWIPVTTEFSSQYTSIVIGISSPITTNFSNTDRLYFKDISVTPLGALIQPVQTGTSQLYDVGPNRIHGQATAGVRVFSSEPFRTVEYPLTSTGSFLTGGSGNPLLWESGLLKSVDVISSLTGSFTGRRNSSSANEFANSFSITTANQYTPVSLGANRNWSANETVWGVLSGSTGISGSVRMTFERR